MKKSILFILIFLPFLSFASHYMGGEITWQCLGNGHFRFIMKLYRECNGIPYNSSETLTVLNCPGLTSITMNLYPGGNPRDAADGALDGKTDISPDCYDALQEIHCSPPPSTANTGAVEEWYFTSDSVYPAGVLISGVPPASGFIFAYTTCCRNPCTNIPNATGLNFFLRAIMYDYQGANTFPCYDNSPVFAESPATVICAGYPFAFNHGAADKELDSLSYEWAPALTDVSTPVTYAAGYSYTSPLPGPVQNPGNIAASLNPATGEISFLSYTSGAFVTVTKVTAYRCGIKIAEIFREAQDILIACPGTNNPPQVSAPFYNPVTGMYDLFTDTVYAGETVNFDITAIDTEFLPNGNPNTLYLEAFSQDYGYGYTDPVNGCPNPPCATLNPPAPLSAMVALATHFSWETDCSHLSQSCLYGTPTGANYYIHNFVFKLSDNACPVPGVVIHTVSIVVMAGPVLPNPTLECAITDSAGDVMISWVAPPDTGNYFYAYILYRSDSLSGTYSAIDTLYDYYQTTFTDSAINPGWDTYHYYYMRTLSGCYGLVSSPGHSNILSANKLVLDIPSADPFVLQWSCADSSAPSGPMYYIYVKCPGQSWYLYDSTQQNFITLSGADSNYNLCQFRVFIVDSSGCNGFSQVLTYDNTGNGEADPAESKCPDVYPNPAKDRIYFMCLQAEIPGISLYDVLGRSHDLFIISSEKENLYSADISSLPEGMYYFRIPGCADGKKLLIVR